MNFYSEPLSSVIKELETNAERGLSPELAARRLEQHGANKLDEKAPRTVFQRFIDQMKDVMIIILLAAAAGARLR